MPDGAPWPLPPSVITDKVMSSVTTGNETITLCIQQDALLRMLRTHQLHASDLQCLNKHQKRQLQQLLLRAASAPAR